MASDGVTTESVLSALRASGPQAGDVSREYVRTMRGPKDWRVNDPNATLEVVWPFLPNSVLSLRVVALSEAVRAEALIDRWGGHPGTSDKRLRFNGNGWLRLPELATTPPGHSPEGAMFQDNVAVSRDSRLGASTWRQSGCVPLGHGASRAGNSLARAGIVGARLHLKKGII